MPEAFIDIEVAWAMPDAQAILALRVPAGSTAAQAVAHVADKIPHRYSTEDLGVFGRRVKPEQVLHDGDRVELYRALVADPKDIRRELARLAKDAAAR
ncbi:MAG: RnfH family protein [Gammaproteobacteria bacterium]